MKRRGFLRLLVATPVALASVTVLPKSNTLLTSNTVELETLAEIKHKGNFGKALWPGISVWYEQAYRDYPKGGRLAWWI